MTNKEAARVHRVINQDNRLSLGFPCLRLFFGKDYSINRSAPEETLNVCH